MLVHGYFSYKDNNYYTAQILKKITAEFSNFTVYKINTENSGSQCDHHHHHHQDPWAESL